ncbi:UNVERIFIED_CONTAM: hypothetical protein HDU68_005721 [Siphonaria sp. JEL0065]|nr:hypothetical protein HDU68_005721 [Siphonaria sp. JEL0065]
MRIAPPPPKTNQSKPDKPKPPIPPKPKAATENDKPPPLKPRPISLKDPSTVTPGPDLAIPPRPKAAPKPIVPPRPVTASVPVVVPPRPSISNSSCNYNPAGSTKPPPALPFRPAVSHISSVVDSASKASLELDDWHPALIKLKNIPKSQSDYTLYDYSEIDNHAFTCPHHVTGSMDSLADFLTAPFPDALSKIRSIFAWVADNIAYDYKGFLTGNIGPQDADSILRTRSSVCEGYASIFLSLCEAAPKYQDHEEVVAIKISGAARGITLSAGDVIADKIGHAWNAVYINGEYRFIETTWAAGASDGTEFRKKYMPGPYFLVPPHHFIYTHIPGEGDANQFLPLPLTLVEWLQLPQTGPMYRAYGARLLSATGLIPNSPHNMLSYLEIDNDYLEIRFEYDPSLTDGVIMTRQSRGTLKQPLLMNPSSVIKIPNPPHSDQLESVPGMPDSGLMFHWEDLGTSKLRVGIVRGFLPKGESCITINGQIEKNGLAAGRILSFRVKNLGGGTHALPPTTYPTEGTVLEPIEGVFHVGQRVHFVVRGNENGIMVTPRNQWLTFKREGGNQVLDVTIECVGQWKVGFQNPVSKAAYFSAVYEAK